MLLKVFYKGHCMMLSILSKSIDKSSNRRMLSYFSLAIFSSTTCVLCYVSLHESIRSPQCLRMTSSHCAYLMKSAVDRLIQGLVHTFQASQTFHRLSCIKERKKKKKNFFSVPGGVCFTFVCLFPLYFSRRDGFSLLTSHHHL